LLVKKPSSKYAIALTAALGLFMAVLDNTIVNVALTPMATALNASLSSIQWVITGYFLTQAAVIPAAGYFSLRFGIKKLFIICLLFFTFGSLLCGLAQSETMLIAFRVLQGLGGGALFPLAQSIALRAFPPAERANASAVTGIPVLLAPAFGPTIGGLLTDTLGWEYIFFINVPVGILAAFLAWKIIPADESVAERKQAPFDFVGLSLSILGVLAVVYAFTLVSETIPGSASAANPRGTIQGWGYWPVWALLGAGVILLVSFAVYELRFVKDPVLDLRLYKNYNFTIASIITWLASTMVFGSLFLLPIFLEQVRYPHTSALDAGLALMPQGLAAGVAVALSGRILYNRIGVRALAMMGAVALIISSWQLSQLTPTSDGVSIMPWIILRGLGFGWAVIPVQTLALQAIVGPALPKASSLFNVMRQIFSSIGIAIVSTLFVQQAAQHATELQRSLPTPPPGVTLDPNSPTVQAARQQLAAQAGTNAVNDVFLIVTIGSIIILLAALALPGRPKKFETTAEGRQPAPELSIAE